MSAPDATMFQADPDVVAERVQDELVIVNLRTNRIYSMNRTAARAWELLAEGCDPSTIRERMCAEYDVGEAELGREMDAFFQSLTAEGLVRTATG